MKELVIISGKGGTGKTSITASFAALAENAVLADCDVDAADLHLVLNPEIKHCSDFIGGKRAEIDPNRCSGCGRCFEVCRFEAVKRTANVDEIISFDYSIDPISCEGCGVCVEVCSYDAIKFDECVNGQWFISDTRFGPLVHAKLGIAEENSGKLVSLIRNEAKRVAEDENKDLLIIDGSPGIGCPVIASITGSDMVLVVTEPTLSGKHDLQRVVRLAEGFNIPVMVCINKADINPEITGQIENEAKNTGVQIAGRIRYTEDFIKAQILKKSIIEYSDNGASEDIRKIWEEIGNVLNT